MFPVSVVVATLIVYLILRRIHPQARNTVVFTISLGVFDVCTDAVWVFYLWTESTVPPAVQYVALAALAVPVVINVVASMVLISGLASDTPESHAWFNDYTPLATVVAFVASGNIGTLELLYSEICNWRGFKAPFSTKDRHTIKQLMIVPLTVQNLPQISIQVYVAITQGLTALLLVTLSASVLTLFFNASQRFFYILLRRNQQRFASSMTALSDELGKTNVVASSSTLDRVDTQRSTTAIEMSEGPPPPPRRIRVGDKPSYSSTTGPPPYSDPDDDTFV